VVTDAISALRTVKDVQAYDPSNPATIPPLLGFARLFRYSFNTHGDQAEQMRKQEASLTDREAHWSFIVALDPKHQKRGLAVVRRVLLVVPVIPFVDKVLLLGHAHIHH
jgi:hypothetical protein